MITYDLSNFITIGCTVAAGFKNLWALEGTKYILYVRDGKLLRTGEMKREWPEISAKEEIRRARKTLQGLDV